jgi:hypothetical protein
MTGGIREELTTEWAVAIVASRENTATLISSVDAVVQACSGRRCCIDVIVNGNANLAEEAANCCRAGFSGGSQTVLRIWSIAAGDKANAINTYIHDLVPSCEAAFFVDGYAQVLPDSLRLMSADLAANVTALGISGVPSVGRSAQAIAKEMSSGGGAHGTLNAVRGSVCIKLRHMNFRLPLRLYRVDSLLFAVLTFGLDPATNVWEPSRVLVQPKASWNFRPLRMSRPADLAIHWHRMLRQAQGKLENRAIREHLAVQRKPPASLPKTAIELIEGWLRFSPTAARTFLLQHPLSWFALRQLRDKPCIPDSSLRPILVARLSA